MGSANKRRIEIPLGYIVEWLGPAIGAGSYLLRNVKVKAQIEKPLRKEIVE